MDTKKRDHTAESIADYQAMNPQEQGQMVARVMEDQPYLMGFLTNIADDFNDDQHEALVDSVMILLNAFIAAGFPVSMIPAPVVEEIIKEKTEAYEEAGKNDIFTDSPKVFDDLRHRAIYKAKLDKASADDQANFNLILDVLISLIERMADYDQSQKDKK